MCGRYTNEAEFSELKLGFAVSQLALFREWRPTYNIGPSYNAGSEQLIVSLDGKGARTLKLARFWFIPSFWSKPLKALPSAFNARAEDLARKPLFRQAFSQSRCLVPATGWREFKGEPGHKQPFHFHLAGELFAFAGLHSEWVSPDGELVDSFAIVTTAPNAVAAQVHERMPLVLRGDARARWLDASASPSALLAEAVQSAQALPLQVYASAKVGNNGRFEGPEVLNPAEPSPSLESRGTGQAELFADVSTQASARRRSPAPRR